MTGGQMQHPDDLLSGLKLGREEYCQRLLTMLIVSGPYPKWNTRSLPSPAGRRFLMLLEERSFGSVLTADEAEFVDEFDLGRRPTDLQGSAPDWALFSDGRLWIVELKTERGSHRDAQVPTYVATGRHYYPDLAVDLTYITGPMPRYAPVLPDGTRYAHLLWEEVLPLVHEVWGGGTEAERAAVSRLDEVLQDLATKWQSWRSTRLSTPEAAKAPAPQAMRTPAAALVEPESDVVAEGLSLARLTAADHEQRAVDFAAGSLEELREVGRALQDALERDGDVDLSYVSPWLWNVDTSTGTALTRSGADVGYELRLSRYRSPQRFSPIRREHVIRAMQEYDALGQEEFLREHGFGRAHEYVLRHEGRGYDSKAIVGVAHLYATGTVLTPKEFSGGKAGAVRVLEELGFEVVGDRRGRASLSAAGSPRHAPEPKPIAVCPVHFTELPSTGACDLCE